ncbi:MAG: HD domain-containing protein [Lactobacillus sp.]|nr:HD domain-containing protein [Lactobacillus sp.]
MLKNLHDYNLGEEFDLVLLIKSVTKKMAKNDKPYLIMDLGDKSVSYRAFLWNVDQTTEDKFQVGDAVSVIGKLEDYHGTTQIRITSIDKAKGDLVDYDNLVPKSKVDQGEMSAQIRDYVLQILNPNWNRIVRNLLQKFNTEFYTYPAGKSNHHAIVGGLSLHTVTMLKLAKSICDIYPQVNRSLLYAGVILHDLGKAIEFTGSVNTQYSTAGNLLGHLVLIDEQIMLVCQNLKLDPNSEDIILIRHMVISHHGLPEYGAAKRPALLEAELLHRIDDMDASTYSLTRELQNTTPGEFTPPIFSQDNRRFYRPKNDQSLDESDPLL